MAESFLKDQLERIRRLTERMTALQNNTAELSQAIRHDREALHQSPLHEVRDYRPYSATHQEAESRRSAVRESSRRRRRR